jgi:hypothetical protein
VIGVFV